MTRYRSQPKDRLRALLITGILQAALLWALIAGLAVGFRHPANQDLALFSVDPAKPPPRPKPVEKRPSASHRPEGAASPPNLRSRATEIVAPPVEITLPSPVVTAPDPGIGMDASTGSADIAGPGTGAGGVGNGTGSGDDGDGDGAGGDETPPRQIGGRMRDGDFPDALRQTTSGGRVGVRYTVLPSGRVGNCRITRSSGVPLLDDTTCRLVTERFRFRPSRDAAGRPVPADIVENHEWVNEMTADDLRDDPLPRRRRGW